MVVCRVSDVEVKSSQVKAKQVPRVHRPQQTRHAAMQQGRFKSIRANDTGDTFDMASNGCARRLGLGSLVFGSLPQLAASTQTWDGARASTPL